jgi:hypothetical protein
MFTLDDMTKKPFNDAVADEDEDEEEVTDIFDDDL